jgi:hypothetical protein
MARNALGLFHDPQAALAAASRLKDAGFGAPDLISPVPLEGAEEVLGEKKSVIKRFTFFGALFGGAAGFTLAAGTAVLWAHPTGGRPIITLPPFLIISYEMTILFGILATVLGFFISARLPAVRDRVYVPEAAVDRFVVAVTCENEEHFERARTLLSQSGAEEVREVEENEP